MLPKESFRWHSLPLCLSTMMDVHSIYHQPIRCSLLVLWLLVVWLVLVRKCALQLKWEYITQDWGLPDSSVGKEFGNAGDPGFDSWVGMIHWRRYRLPTPVFLGFPCSSAVKRIRLQCRRPGFDPWVEKIPWRRERLPTPVFWPGEFHELYIYSPWGCKELDMTERLSLLLYPRLFLLLCPTHFYSSILSSLVMLWAPCISPLNSTFCLM